MTRRQGGLVAGAAILAAISNFVALWIARRFLPDVALYEEFVAFWSLVFGLFGVISGVQNEATRAAGAVAAGRDPRGRLLVPAALVALGTALLVVLAFWLVGPAVVPRSGWGAGACLVATALLYPLHVTLVGATAGRGLWDHYAALIAGEVTLRMVLFGVVAATGLGLIGFEWAVLAAIAVSVLMLVSSRARSAFAARSDAPLGASLRQTLVAVLSTSCTAVLVTAFPALMKGTSHGVDAALTAGLMMAVSLCRAPIMMPLTSFQGVAIKAFLAHRHAPLRAVAKPAAALVALGLVGAIGAWLVGPWFLSVLFRLSTVPGWVFAALTFESAFLAILTLLGALALAVDRHLLYAAGWVVASVVAIGTLLLVADPTWRTVASLGAGPLAGCLVVLAGLTRPGATRRAAELSPSAG